MQNFKIDAIYAILPKNKNAQKNFKRNFRKKRINGIHFFSNKTETEIQLLLKIFHAILFKKTQMNLIIMSHAQPLSGLHFPNPPSCDDDVEKWNIAFLGGEVKKVLHHSESNNFENLTTDWERAIVTDPTAFLINLQEVKKLDKLIKQELSKNFNSLDLNSIWDNMNSIFLTRPIFVNRHSPKVKDLSITPEKIESVKWSEEKLDGYEGELGGVKRILHNIQVADEELPYISIVTVTADNKNLFDLTIRNFYKTAYPKNKMEWIIVDSGKNKIKDLLPLAIDNRLKYIPTESYSSGEGEGGEGEEERGEVELSIGQQFNLAIERANKESKYILHLMDGNYYYPNHARTRVVTLLTLESTSNNHNVNEKENVDEEVKGEVNMTGEVEVKDEVVGCIGSTEVGFYDLFFNRRFLQRGTDIHGHHTILHRASLAYSRSFWEEERFNPSITGNIELAFVKNRMNRCREIPHHFFFVGLSYNTSYDLPPKNEEDRFLESLDEETAEFIGLIKTGFEVNSS